MSSDGLSSIQKIRKIRALFRHLEATDLVVKDGLKQMERIQKA